MADDIDKSVEICEVKRQQKDLDLSILRSKAEVFLNATKKFKRYTIKYQGLSMDDM